MGNELCNFRHIGVIADNISDTRENIELDQFKSIVKIVDGHAVAGCFEDEKGNKKLLLVNLSLNKRGSVTLCFDREKISGYILAGQESDRRYNIYDKEQPVVVDLEPGEGKLLELINE